VPPSALREKLGGSVKPRHFSDTFARRQLKHLLNSYRFFSTGALVREGNIFFAHCQWIFAAGRLDDDEKVAQPRVAPRCEKIRSLNLI
jgi:hypothetical protein